MSIVRIGTSGFSFDDWSGVFYPKDVSKKDWFTYYAEYFPVTEINMTYYRIPSKKVFESLNDRSPGGFEFFVKLHQDATHGRKDPAESVESLAAVTEPVAKSGKLRGFLAQFPYGFRNNGGNRRRLAAIAGACGGVPLFVEFRHDSWDNPAVYEFLRNGNIGYCCVDEPPLPGMLPPQDVTTGDTGYVRFHGRNSETWWDSSKGDRYDYSYTKDELFDWVERIREINRKTSKSYLFFNNCHAGQAVRNAKTMAELLKNPLGIDTVLKDIPIQ